MVIQEIRSRTGGLIRIMDDCMAKSEPERKRRREQVQRVCCEVLANSAALMGTVWVLEQMDHGPHAELWKG